MTDMNETRELSFSEIDQVSGGNVKVFFDFEVAGMRLFGGMTGDGRPVTVVEWQEGGATKAYGSIGYSS